MLCSVDINEQVELDFTLQVFGTTSQSVEPRFIIIGPEFAIVCFCIPQENSVKVTVPRLAGIIPAGMYKVRFEVLLGEQIFVPIEDEIELSSPVKVEVKMAQAEPTRQKVDVKVTPKQAPPAPPQPEPAFEEVEKAEEPPEPKKPEQKKPDPKPEPKKVMPVEPKAEPVKEAPAPESLIKTLAEAEKRFNLFKSVVGKK